MKRFLLTSGLAAVAFAAMTLSAFADDRPAAVLAGHAGDGQGLLREADPPPGLQRHKSLAVSPGDGGVSQRR